MGGEGERGRGRGRRKQEEVGGSTGLQSGARVGPEGRGRVGRRGELLGVGVGSQHLLLSDEARRQGTIGVPPANANLWWVCPDPVGFLIKGPPGHHGQMREGL